MNRIEKKFKELKRRHRKAFIAFLTAGYPDLTVTERLVYEFSRLGVDLVELGVPFSDPMADGPVIQESSQAALKKGVNLNKILGLVKKVRLKSEIPICLMTYYNPIFCFGEAKFARLARASGVDGIIIPDLPPDEGRPFVSLAHKNKLDVICFIAPTTSGERIKYILNVARGFIYYISLTGVTGPRRELPADLRRHLKSIKKVACGRPVCVGFGVSRPDQVKEVYKIADGVIVGSAIVKKIKENLGRPDLIRRTANFVGHLADV